MLEIIIEEEMRWGWMLLMLCYRGEMHNSGRMCRTEVEFLIVDEEIHSFCSGSNHSRVRVKQGSRKSVLDGFQVVMRQLCTVTHGDCHVIQGDEAELCCPCVIQLNYFVTLFTAFVIMTYKYNGLTSDKIYSTVN